MPEAKPHSPSFVQMAIISVVLLAILMFLVIAFNTEDLLWFVSSFDEVPARIIVHCYGTDVRVEAGSPAFQAVTVAVNESLSGSKRWDSLSMSDVTFQEYQTNAIMMVLELKYDPPVRVHSQYKFFKKLDTIIIPLDGRHASANAFFGRLGDYTAAGSFHTKTMAPIIMSLAENGVCQKP